MSGIGIVIVLLAGWMALKAAGLVVKLLLWGLVLFGLWWFLAPYLGLPAPF